MTLLFWIIFSIAVGALAGKYGRSSLGWFFLALFISPLLGIVFLLIAGKTLLRRAEEATLVQQLATAGPVLPMPTQRRTAGAAAFGPPVIVTIALLIILLCFAALLTSRSTGVTTVQDPPLPRERSWVLHTDIEQQLSEGEINWAAQKSVDINPFTERGLCRATLATMNSRHPSDYGVSAYSNEGTLFDFVRQSDGKRFAYWCRVEPGQVRVALDAPKWQWNKNTRHFYKLSADRTKMEIEYWSMPSAEARRAAEKFGSSDMQDELLERRSFSKEELG